MSQRYLGGIITANPTAPTLSSASGVWTLEQQFQYSQTIQPEIIGNSLRFRASASAYMNRTNGSPTAGTKYTVSMWVKRGQLGRLQGLIGVYPASSASDSNTQIFEFNASDQLQFTGFSTIWRITTAVYRDPSAWYHIVLAYDSTQATASNRELLYVNGVQVTSFATSNDVAQNTVSPLNSSGSVVYLGQEGAAALGVARYFDGYMAEVYFIDGQALTPSSFGAFDSTGVWQPLGYTGTFGTNGFYVDFSDNSGTTSTTLGKDYSGNGNNWTPNNFSLTAGATYDWMLDSPTNWSNGTGNGVGNYCVLNPLFASQTSVASGSSGTAPTISNGNQTVTAAGGSVQTSAIGTFGVTTGKWYCEYIATAVNGTGDLFGFIQTFNGGLALNGYRSTGYIYNQGAATSATTWTTGDVIGMALDCDAGTLACYKNNTLIATVTITGGVTAPMFPIVWFRDASGAGSVNFGQRPFASTPPTGFKALNTLNLPNPTILNGAQVMAATTYTGNGATYNLNNGANTTTGVSFKPDLVWQKNRSSAANNILVDSVRGGSLYLISNTTGADASAPGYMTFNSNGESFTSSDIATNQTGQSYIAWQWQAGQGTTSSNTSGTITSTVSVGATQGFSVVTFTAPGGSAQTIGHGLGVAPSLIIIKSRNNVSGWNTYHASVGNTGALNLQTTAATSTSIDWWNNTSPTSSVWTIGANLNISTWTFVAYCWAAVAGYSAFGSYTGNGSTDGPFLYFGFRPRWIMYKRTDTTGNWNILDTSRDPINLADTLLRANLSNADEVNTVYAQDFLSNGWKIRSTNVDINVSGATYIYAAFAENPFKIARAR